MLYVTYGYEPVTSASSIRAVNFVNAIVEQGLRTIVVADDVKTRFERVSDLLTVCTVTGQGQIPDQLARESLPRWPWWKQLPGPDPQNRFVKAAFRVCNNLIARYKPGLVFVTMPPFSFGAMGCELARRHDLPLVVEFRDAWYSAMPWPYDNVLQRHNAGRWERLCVGTANKVVAVTDGIRQALADAYGDDVARKTSVVRHGFDDLNRSLGVAGSKSADGLLTTVGPGDAGQPNPVASSGCTLRSNQGSDPGRNPHPNTPAGLGCTTHPNSVTGPDGSDRPFTIAYTGQLRGIDIVAADTLSRAFRRTHQGLRRMLLGASFCEKLQLDWMSPHYLLSGLSQAAQKDSGFRHSVRLVFVGEEFTQIDTWAREMGIADLVEQLGPVPVQQAQRIAEDADMLVLTLYGIRDCAYHWCVPSKLYTYLGSGNAVLALLPPGEALDLVTRAGTAVPVAPDDPAAIARKLLDCFNLHRRQSAIVKPNWPFIDQFRLSVQRDNFTNLIKSVLFSGIV